MYVIGMKNNLVSVSMIEDRGFIRDCSQMQETIQASLPTTSCIVTHSEQQWVVWVMAQEDGPPSSFNFEDAKRYDHRVARFQYRAEWCMQRVCFGKVHQDCFSEQRQQIRSGAGVVDSFRLVWSHVFCLNDRFWVLHYIHRWLFQEDLDLLFEKQEVKGGLDLVPRVQSYCGEPDRK